MAAKPAAAEMKQPIIIKKRKIIAAGHHGGAWKVAYADFVTAMMAFFMVMWLVASVNNEQRSAIFEYFKNPSMESGKSPKPAPGQMGPGGASTSPINMHGGMDSPRTVTQKQGVGAAVTPLGVARSPTDEEAARMALAAEQKSLETLLGDLRGAIEKSATLTPFKEQLLLDITPEGLRIQIVDGQNRAMFDTGSAKVKEYTRKILLELGPYLQSVPNHLSVTGHTDVAPYGNNASYGNWELSADRANAARRTLEAGGLAREKLSRVVGLGSTVLFDRVHPTAPINRRISIIVMTRRAEELALIRDVPDPVSPASTQDSDKL